jgi:hypothetical protein
MFQEKWVWQVIHDLHDFHFWENGFCIMMPWASRCIRSLTHICHTEQRGLTISRFTHVILFKSLASKFHFSDDLRRDTRILNMFVILSYLHAIRKNKVPNCSWNILEYAISSDQSDVIDGSTQTRISTGCLSLHNTIRCTLSFDIQTDPISCAVIDDFVASCPKSVPDDRPIQNVILS